MQWSDHLLRHLRRAWAVATIASIVSGVSLLALGIVVVASTELGGSLRISLPAFAALFASTIVSLYGAATIAGTLLSVLQPLYHRRWGRTLAGAILFPAVFYTMFLVLLGPWNPVLPQLLELNVLDDVRGSPRFWLAGLFGVPPGAYVGYRWPHG